MVAPFALVLVILLLAVSGALAAPLTAGSTLTITFAALGAASAGTMDADGAPITGTWRQGPASLPLVLRRAPTAGVETTLPLSGGMK